MLSVTYNGHELNEILMVTDGFTQFVGADWENSLVEVGDSNGELYAGRKLKPLKITMPFMIRGDILQKYRTLQRILSVSEPKILTFGSAPNVYYNAVADGNLKFEQLNRTDGKGTITWIVPEGHGYSIAESVFRGEAQDDSVKAVITNGGNKSVRPVITLINKAENGYFRITDKNNKRFTVGVGSDATNRKERVLYAWNQYDYDSFTTGQGYFSRSYFTKTGTKKYENVNNVQYVSPNSLPSVTGGWNAVIMTKTNMRDSVNSTVHKDFIFTTGLIFKSTVHTQEGLMEIALADASNQILASLTIAKYTQSNNSAEVILIVNGAERQRVQIDASNHACTNNDFMLTIEKKGATISFYFGSAKYDFYYEEIAEKGLKTISFAMARRNTSNLTTMKFGNISLISTAVSIPASSWFHANDVVEIDCKKGQVILNNNTDITDFVHAGSEFFEVGLDGNELSVSVSATCTTLPDLEVKIREELF